MIYRLPPLPYEYNALEPFIDALTMEIHHTKHHASYVDNLNKALVGLDNLSAMPLEDILADIRSVPEEVRQQVRNHGGGHLNHSLFWQIMGPGAGGEPTGTLREAIDATFGNYASFKDEFVRTAMTRFGSGWAWLGVDHNGGLEVINTPNQDSPIMLGYRPILGLDLWEHAYYLKYQNRRADYVAAWWNVVQWEKVAEIHHHCMDMVARAR
jgi:Fe-Mn family superoxide dismutase